jgi:hypothetical protein
VFYKASDVTRPNEGYVLAESFSIEFDETPAVFRFLLGYLQKDLGRSPIVLPNGVRILDEDAGDPLLPRKWRAPKSSAR